MTSLIWRYCWTIMLSVSTCGPSVWQLSSVWCLAVLIGLLHHGLYVLQAWCFWHFVVMPLSDCVLSMWFSVSKLCRIICYGPIICQFVEFLSVIMLLYQRPASWPQHQWYSWWIIVTLSCSLCSHGLCSTCYVSGNSAVCMLAFVCLETWMCCTNFDVPEVMLFHSLSGLICDIYIYIYIYIYFKPLCSVCTFDV